MTEVLIPIADRLLIEKRFYETKSAGGLEIVMARPQADSEGTVVAIGPDVKNDWEIGDLVVFMQNCGFPVVRGELTEHEKTYVCMKEDEVLIKVKDSKELIDAAV